MVNEAKGDAAKIVQSAQGYREQTVREAEGDAARFNQVYEQYRRAPAVTRERLYIETMERVLAKSNKVIVDGKGTSAPIILPPLRAAGFDLIWFGIVMAIVMEMGLIHPPVGLNIFVINRIAPDIGLGAVIRGTIPFVILLAVGVVILSFLPGIAMWLPNVVYGK